MNLKDLARHLDLSVTTVSRGLAGYGEVNVKTRDKILKAAKEMGYEPNSFATGLKKGKTNLIGLILPYSESGYEDLYCQSIALEVSTALSSHGYNLVLVGSLAPEEELENLKKLVTSKSVDGIILVRTRLNDEKIRYIQSTGMPFVCHGKTEDNLPYSFVDSDGEKGLRLATERLIRFGHKRIAFIANEVSYYATKIRLNGYKSALEMYGLDFEQNLCRFGKVSKSAGIAFTKELMDLPEPPTAFVCYSDILALGVTEEIRNRGLEIGKQISIIGYDDFPISRLMLPALTSVNSNFRLMGKKLVEFVIQRINGTPIKELQTVTDVSISSRLSDGPFIEAE